MLRSLRSYNLIRLSLLVIRIRSSEGIGSIPVTFLPRPFLLRELWTWIVVWYFNWSVEKNITRPSYVPTTTNLPKLQY